jgi:hypothetical protein
MTSIAVGNRRLLRLAKILDKADALHKKRGEPVYDQKNYVHPCGAPACAFGHWAFANPKKFNLRPVLGGNGEIKSKNGKIWYTWDDIHTQNEFSLTEEEAEKLFADNGCESARTAKQAAKYIRAFVKRRSKK